MTNPDDKQATQDARALSRLRVPEEPQDPGRREGALGPPPREDGIRAQRPEDPRPAPGAPTGLVGVL